MIPFRTLRPIVMGIVISLVTGCAGLPPLPWQTLRPDPPLSTEQLADKAGALEAQGEWRQALFTWQVAAHLDPDDDTLGETVAALESKLAAEAEAHYQKGVAHFQGGSHEAARLAFLTALRLNPDHAGARRYLLVRLHTAGHATYRVQRGDSFTKIANDIYKDVSKAYILAYFNDMDPHRPLLIGTQLVLPELSPEQLLPRRDLLALLEQAQQALQASLFAAAIDITERIRTQSPGNVQALQLADAARFGLAMALMEQKAYPEALEQLRQVRSGYRGRAPAITRARRMIAQQTAENQLRLAQERLDRGEFAAAIGISREILEEEPNLRAARGIFDAANYGLGRELLEQGREVEAIEALRHLDKNYQDTAQLLNQAYARRNARAETLYREGVMHFLREELELAIEAWEKSLALNPDHPKARQDMENARRLLDKWHRLVPPESAPGDR